MIDDLFNTSYNPHLNKKKLIRRLDDHEWDAIEKIVETLLPLKAVYYKQQSEGYWTLSDAASATTNLLRTLLDQDQASNEREDQLVAVGKRLPKLDVLQANMRTAMIKSIESKVTWLQDFQEEKAASMLALMLDPRYKQLGILSAYFRGNVPRDLLQRYTALLLGVAEDAYNWNFPSKEGSKASDTPSDPNSFGVIYQLKVSDSSSAGVVKEELEGFRSYRLTQAEEAHPMDWWPKNKDRFPSLYVVARAIFTIPGSQNDVERLFSIAGYLSANRRNGMSTEMLEELVLINRNWPELKEELRQMLEEDNLPPEEEAILIKAMSEL